MAAVTAVLSLGRGAWCPSSRPPVSVGFARLLGPFSCPSRCIAFHGSFPHILLPPPEARGGGGGVEPPTTAGRRQELAGLEPSTRGSYVG